MSREIDRLESALSDRYAVERELGRGGMATVYLAQDLKHNRQVAIKVLLPEIAATLGTKRFLVEIETAARLNHPHILPLYDSGEVEGFVYYVMPYVEGESLRERLERDRQLVIEDALTIAREVADALSYAHAQGVVHRDIKPENILISAGHAVLADFGIARAISEAGDERLTGTGLVLGSPEYMSPEQATGQTIDGRADIYALGCVLYEMLSGEPPFIGRTPQAILARRVTEPPPSVRAMRDTVPLRIDETVRQALARVPADRFDTAASMVEALRAPTGLEQAIEIDSRTVVADQADRRPLVRVIGAMGAMMAAAALVFYALRLGTSGASTLEATRVMIFPAQTPAAIAATVGEEIATMIGYALDGAGGMRAIDGWTFLDADERENVRLVTDSRVRELAESRRTAFAVTGRLMIAGPDSVAVILTLVDVAGDSMLRQARVEGPLAEPWRPGLAAVNQLLPAMIEGAPEIDVAFEEVAPGGIANFLRGEAAFRRAHFADAFRFYEAAVDADSAFGLAAIRGAQAAAWNEDLGKASSLLRVALAQPLPDRYAALARGMGAYVGGDAEAAIRELEGALAEDDELAFAWIQLGEVYSHLVVRRSRPDSLAEAAFTRAQALDSTAVHALYHLIESQLRRGDLERAEPLVQRFLVANPDNPDVDLAGRIRLMERCMRGGPEAAAWEQAATETPATALAAAHALAVGGGYQLRCAESGFRAILAADTTESLARWWGAVQGLVAALVAQGHYAEAGSFLDSAVAAGDNLPKRLYPIGAILGLDVSVQADEVVQGWFEEMGPGSFTSRLWNVVVWSAHRNDTKKTAAAAQMMEEIAAKSEVRYDSILRIQPLEAADQAERARHDRLLGRAARAHLALALADTAEALRRFRALTPNSPRTSLRYPLNWDLQEPLALEQLRLAEILLARGQAQEALDVASAFDSPGVLAFVPFLAVSIELRTRAAEELGDAGLAEALRARLAALRGNAGQESPTTGS